jgi:hypothetical protein
LLFDIRCAPLKAGEAFNVTLAIGAGIGHHAQHGFEIRGPNVRSADVANLGWVTMSAAPEPPTLLLMAVGALGLALRQRRSWRSASDRPGGRAGLQRG